MTDILDAQNQVRGILNDGGDLEVARSLIVETLATQPSSTTSMTLHAMVLEQMGRTAEATEVAFAVHRAMIANPPPGMAIYDLVHATVRLVKLLHAQGRNGDAIAALAGALEIVPGEYAGKLVILQEQIAANRPLRDPTRWDIYLATEDGEIELEELEQAAERSIEAWIDDAIALVALTRGPEQVRPHVSMLAARAVRQLESAGKDAGSTDDVTALALLAIVRACGVAIEETDAIATRLSACARMKRVDVHDAPALALLLAAAGRGAEAMRLLPPYEVDDVVETARGFRYGMATFLTKASTSPSVAASAHGAFRWFVAEFPGAIGSRWGEGNCPRWRDLMLGAIVAAQLEGEPVDKVAEALRQSIVDPQPMPPMPERAPRKAKSKAKSKAKPKAKAKMKPKKTKPTAKPKPKKTKPTAKKKAKPKA